MKLPPPSVPWLFQAKSNAPAGLVDAPPFTLHWPHISSEDWP